MGKGLDKLFDLPLLGLLLKVLFSERLHMLLAFVFFLGGLCWLVNHWMESAVLDAIALFSMRVPMLLFGVWMVLAFLFVLIDKCFPGSNSQRGMTKKQIEKLLDKAKEEGQLELSVRYSAGVTGFSTSSTSLTLDVSGGQSDPVDREIGEYLQKKTGRRVQVRAGKNAWRRLVVFLAN